MTNTEPKIVFTKTIEGYAARLSNGAIAIVCRNETNGTHKWQAVEANVRTLELPNIDGTTETLVTGYNKKQYEQWAAGKTRKEAVLDALIHRWYI